MPKQVSADKKKYFCRWCEKGYVYQSGKLNHEKSAHPEEYSESKIKKAVGLVDRGKTREAKLKQLQQQVFDGTISMEEYQEIKAELEQVQVPVAATLDVGRVLNKDYLYIYGHLIKTFGEDGVQTIVNMSLDHRYSVVFNKIFSTQLFYLEDRFGTPSFEYLDGETLGSHEITSFLLRRLVNNVVSAIYQTLSRPTDIIADETIDEYDPRQLEALSNFDRLNTLMHSSCSTNSSKSLLASVLASKEEYNALVVLPRSETSPTLSGLA